jgi:DNA-binding MarR family transcriptional regulator
MHDRLPLPTLLSHALVAFTIEFDNESEYRMPHRTTNHGATTGSLHAPWLVSLVMWLNCMCFVTDEGITVRELERLARMPTNLNGMERWGYIIVEPDPADRRPKPPRNDWVIRATGAGRKAQEVWRPLADIIEKRWQERFGKAKVDQLRKSLWALTGQLSIALPDCLPILGYGLFSKGPEYERRISSGIEPDNASSVTLPTLISKVLLAFAMEFERDSEISLAISANLLRLLGEEAVRVRDLPRLSGVSKEAIAMSLKFLVSRGHALLEPESSGSRVKLVVLTSKGRNARDAYRQLVGDIEQRWQERFAKGTVPHLRESLEPLMGDPAAHPSPLLLGLEPHADGWRASLPKPEGLPHYPMILHRGGFPDGS